MQDLYLAPCSMYQKGIIIQKHIRFYVKPAPIAKSLKSLGRMFLKTTQIMPDLYQVIDKIEGRLSWLPKDETGEIVSRKSCK